MISALVQGRLQRDPKQGKAKNGSSYLQAMVYVLLDEGEWMSVSAIAFEPDVIKLLERLTKDDAVCLSGAFSPSVYQGSDGRLFPSARMTVHAAMTPYQIKRKRGD